MTGEKRVTVEQLVVAAQSEGYEVGTATGPEGHTVTTPDRLPDAYFDRDGFVPARLGREVKEVGRLRLGPDGRLWRYEGGVYRPRGDTFVSDFVRDRLGERYRRRHLDEVLSWCRAEFPSIPETPDPSAINVANGMLDWRTGALTPHDPAVPSIVQIPVSWDPTARCPAIEGFLGEVLPDDAVEMFFELAGYSLHSEQRLRRAAMFLGSGGNGKSTAIGLLHRLLGPDNVASVALQELAESRFAVAELYGKLANLCGDLDARALRRSDVFKTLTGGTDRVMGERKYRDPFYFLPFATLVFSANEAPPSSDQTDAYFDRWIILPFEQRFEGTDDQDPHILEKLTTPEEMSGFLVRAVDALGNLMDRGRFDLPASVLDAGKVYRERVDTVGSFISECCVIDTEARVTRKAIYAAYRRYCGEHGRLPVSAELFHPRLRQQLGGRIDDGASSGKRGYYGVGLLEEER